MTLKAPFLPENAPLADLLDDGDAWSADAPDSDEFADLAAMAAQVLGAAGALIAIREGGRLRALTTHGIGGLRLGVHHPLFDGLDASTPQRLVLDASQSAPYCDDALVTASPGVRFAYALALFDVDNTPVGVLAVLDSSPRASMRAQGVEMVERLARLAARLVERRRLQRSNRIAEQIAQADFSGVVVIDGDGLVSFANTAAGLIFGAPIDVGTPIETLFPRALQADADATARWLRDGAPGLHEGMRSSRDLRMRTADGDRRTVEAARCAWLAGGAHGMALILRDVTERRLLRDRGNATPTDELTGLPRRASLLSTLDAFLRDAVRPLGVALLGLDSFRTVNDTLGHMVGDAVLQLVACRLQFSLPTGVRLARFGGDEFALIYPEQQQDAIHRHLRTVLHDLSRPCEVDHNLVHIEASVGVAMCDSDDIDSGELIARADLAMQRAKRGGGRQLRAFEPDMRVEAHDRRRLDLELRRACDEGEFELHYQPQIDLLSGRPTGAEALLRWRHPERGLLTPDKFIDALAQSSVNATVGRWILERACKDAAHWPAIDGHKLAVGINLFPVQLDDERLLHEVDQALTASGLLPARLELELTETIALRDDGIAASALASLRARGIRVAYDDFGTGYASLSMLQRLPVDRVKIDRSFVRDVLANRGDAAIVRSILLIARNFDLRVIAEGVETDEQAQMLRDLGCEEAQGFLYSRALHPDDFGRWLASYQVTAGHA